MNITHEKEHIYSIMRDVTAERRKLTELYQGLKERLDTLHALEERDVKELDMQGYVDLHTKLVHDSPNTNQQPRTIQASVIKEQTPRVGILPDKQEVSRFQKEIDEERNNSKPLRRPAKLGIDQLALTISSILKEEKEPMSLGEIHDEVQQRLNVSIDKRNFRNNIMYRVNKMSDTVERSSHGYYQYKE